MMALRVGEVEMLVAGKAMFSDVSPAERVCDWRPLDRPKSRWRSLML